MIDILRILASSLVLCLAIPICSFADGSRQLGTGGGTQFEGSAGGGIVPWASIAGYVTREETGITGFLTRVDVGDYTLNAQGAALGLQNRVELSLARQELDLLTLGPAIGMPGASLEQDILGIKVRLAGDLVYSRWPQFAVGLQHKRNRSFAIPKLVGARDDSGTDFYVSAAKLWLAGVRGYNGFANATLRWSRANELGLLGFGGDRKTGRSLLLEASAGVFLNRHWALGLEYRQKPSNLAFAREDDWWDLFLAWFPNRNVSVVAAYVDLGSIASLPGQSGWYLSVEGAY